MKAILTRHGENTTYIIDGDPDQCDLGRGVENGLEHVVWMVNHFDLPVAVVRFTERDCVRSAECRMWVNAFKRMEEPVLPRFVTGVAANSR
jgi:phosphate starvation-inducible PhoH-like protein